MNETMYLIILAVVAIAVIVGPELGHMFFFRSSNKAHGHKIYARDARTVTERIVREAWDDTTPVLREETTRVKNAEYKPAEEITKTTLSPVERVKNMGGR